MGDDFPPISDRSPYGRHLLVGGNTTMLGLIRDQAATLAPNATAAAFEATIAATRDQLEQRTASLELGVVAREGDSIQIPITVANLAGHKLPTGFPSRRVFLRVELRDAADELVFCSGCFDAKGRLVDQAGEVIASELAGGPVMPHYQVLSGPEQVQIWEAIMADPEGEPTYRLLRATSYLKDNRLLPRGWDPALAGPDIAPAGLGGDPNFDASGDTLVVTIEAPSGAGPYTLRAEAYYQTLSPRFLAELFVLDGPKIRAFEAMVEAANTSPERLASAQASVD
jgi:hypothetical protein